MDKSPDAFRTISEVAADLALPQHVLRFWETKFPQIRPLKRGGGRRYYRPDDVDLLKGIRHLLYGEGYTIRGVQRLLKAQGVRFVMGVWRDGAPQPGRGALAAAGQDGNGAHDPAEDEFVEGDFAEEDGFDEAGLDADGQPASAAAMAQRFAPQGAPDELDRVVGRPRDMVEAPLARAVGPAGGEAVAQAVRVARAPGSAADTEPRSTFGHLIDRFRGQPRGEGDTNQPPPLNSSLSRDEIRRLQATLFELLECKRLLDQAR